MTLPQPDLDAPTGIASRVAAFARVVGIECAERVWPLGGAGVEAVAARLGRLGDGWRVLHGVPLGPDRTIDQLVVGPGGVFAVCVRYRPQAAVWVGGSTVLVDGAPEPWVTQAQTSARRAGALLGAATGRPVDVSAVVVVVGAHDGFVVQHQPGDVGVHVLTRRDVDGWLRTQATVLAEPACAEVFTAARRAATWHV